MGQGSPTEYPPSLYLNADLRLILFTGQGETAKPLRCKTSLSLSVWLSLTPHPTLCLLPPLWSVPLGVFCEPVCWSLLPLSVWLAPEGWWVGGSRREERVAGETEAHTAGLLSNCAL